MSAFSLLSFLSSLSLPFFPFSLPLSYDMFTYFLFCFILSCKQIVCLLRCSVGESLSFFPSVVETYLFSVGCYVLRISCPFRFALTPGEEWDGLIVGNERREGLGSVSCVKMFCDFSPQMAMRVQWCPSKEISDIILPYESMQTISTPFG